MNHKYKLAFVGCGQMGQAILKGLLGNGLLKPQEAIICDPAKKDELYGVKLASELNEALTQAKNILIAVKPQQIPVIAADLSKSVQASQLIISIVAGLETVFWESLWPDHKQPVIRSMPNTPSLVGAGFTGLCRGHYAEDDHFSEAAQIFKAVGQVVETEEKLFHALSALSGCGPAYMFAFLEALSEGAIMLGLNPALAHEAAAQTMLGSAKLYLEEKKQKEALGQTPTALAELRQRVTSAGGVTARGLYALEKKAFKGTVMDALVAADKKSRSLARQAERTKKHEK